MLETNVFPKLNTSKRSLSRVSDFPKTSYTPSPSPILLNPEAISQVIFAHLADVLVSARRNELSICNASVIGRSVNKDEAKLVCIRDGKVAR